MKDRRKCSQHRRVRIDLDEWDHAAHELSLCTGSSVRPVAHAKATRYARRLHRPQKRVKRRNTTPIVD
jgi:hypothetical protein